jgi:long-chain acyl-CoA synthetase
MIERFLNHPDFKPAEQQHLKWFMYGAAPISVATIQALCELLPGVRLVQGYGMTEMGVITTLSDRDHRVGGQRRLSAGRPVVGVATVLRDASGEQVPARQVGELYVRADAGMRGYWRNPEGTQEALRDGWYRTGDVGYFDEEGYLYIVDRAKDMIVTGAENVYSLEVERAIEQLPGVAQVAVFGIPSKQWGEQVHAVVVPASGVTLAIEMLAKELRKVLAGYKCPKSWQVRMEPLPVSGTNKIVKTELKKAYWGSQQRVMT